MEELNKQLRGIKVCVAGATGFLGMNLSLFLAESGADVIGIVSPSSIVRTDPRLNILHSNGIRTVAIDLTVDSKKLQTILKDTQLFFQCAALDGGTLFKKKHPYQMLSINSKILFTVLDAIKDFVDLRTLMFSSTDVYPSDLQGDISEDMIDTLPIHPSATNAWNKRFLEMSVRSHVNEYNSKIYIARLGNTYGRFDASDDEKMRLVPKLIKYSLEGKSLQLFGNGESIISLLHSDDVCRNSIRLIFSNATMAPIHVVSQQYTSLIKLAQQIVLLTNSVSEVTFSGGNELKRRFSPDKAISAYAFHEDVELKLGLEKYIRQVYEK
jgi:nucleoside-diphosphate-sugar epimerase